MPGPHEQRHRPALAEAGQDHTVGGHAASRFARDERLHQPRRLPHVARVLTAARPPQGHDVVPGGHDEATVDGDAPRGGVGEDEPHLRELEEGHDRLEVVPAGPQAVQPDHRAGGLPARIDLEGGRYVRHLSGAGAPR